MGFPPFMGDVRDSLLGSEGGDTLRSCGPAGDPACPPKDQLDECATGGGGCALEEESSKASGYAVSKASLS